MEGGVEAAAHARSWDKRRHIEDPVHVDKLIERRKASRGPKRRQRLEEICPQMRLYLAEVAKRHIHLSHEVEKLWRLIDQYGEVEVIAAVSQAIVHRTIGARYVRALCDQARFARGLGEPPEPVVTGNSAADNIDVQPHDMEIYDALFDNNDK
jgi:hypothetical protein